MMLTEVGVGKTHNSRKSTGRAVKQGKGVRANTTKLIAMGDAQTNRSSGEVVRTASDANRIPVTVWGPNGSCYEGMSP